MVQSTHDSTLQHDNLLGHEILEDFIYGLHPHYQYICGVSATTIKEGPLAYIKIQMPDDGKTIEE